MRSEQLGALDLPSDADPARPATPSTRTLFYLSLPIFLIAPLALWFNLAHYLVARPPVRVTAHRGNARTAPENTLSAVRKSIESGADYAEIDVQLTSDGVIMLLHDRDLKRVASDPRRIADVTYADVRKLDVGSWFGPAFAGERVPTLAEVIDLAKGKIKLNIELKFYSRDRQLARDVARLIRDKQFLGDCIITSLDFDALPVAQAEAPGVRTGLIIATALGDVSRLKLDAISVRAGALTNEMIRRAHRANKEVHVWSVKDPREMARLIQRGADNLITDDPDVAIRVRDEWESLSWSDKLVLTARLLLGIEERREDKKVEPGADWESEA
jgi:glycerophosphoryl diester phosphodiesterase